MSLSSERRRRCGVSFFLLLLSFFSSTVALSFHFFFFFKHSISVTFYFANFLSRSRVLELHFIRINPRTCAAFPRWIFLGFAEVPRRVRETIREKPTTGWCQHDEVQAAGSWDKPPVDTSDQLTRWERKVSFRWSFEAFNNFTRFFRISIGLFKKC